MGLDEVDLQVAALRVVVDAQVELADAGAAFGGVDDDRASLSCVQVELQGSQRTAELKVHECSSIKFLNRS